jgi:hypothetical protein
MMRRGRSCPWRWWNGWKTRFGSTRRDSVLPVVNSLCNAADNLMGAPARREALRRVQTPQSFRFADILAAHRAWTVQPMRVMMHRLRRLTA